MARYSFPRRKSVHVEEGAICGGSRRLSTFPYVGEEPWVTVVVTTIQTCHMFWMAIRIFDLKLCKNPY